MLKAAKKEKKVYKTRGLSPTYVDLSRTDVYQLCYDLDENEERIFTGKINEQVLVERPNSLAENGKEFHLCIVFGIGQFKGICEDKEKSDYQIRLWDEVLDQMHYIDMSFDDLPYCLRTIKNVKIRKPQKREKNDYIIQHEDKEEIVEDIKNVDLVENLDEKTIDQLEIDDQIDSE
jgi:hypothetical protein